MINLAAPARVFGALNGPVRPGMPVRIGCRRLLVGRQAVTELVGLASAASWAESLGDHQGPLKTMRSADCSVMVLLGLQHNHGTPIPAARSTRTAKSLGAVGAFDACRARLCAAGFRGIGRHRRSPRGGGDAWCGSPQGRTWL